MREIKVRGYAVDEMVGSQWVYGTGVHRTVFTEEFAKECGQSGETFIWTDSGWVLVHDESVSEYTGLNDKNGKEIFEGDIETDENGNLSVVCYLQKYGAYCFVPVVLYLHEDYENKVNYEYGTDCYFHNAVPSIYSEIVGNIYENPELLEVAG